MKVITIANQKGGSGKTTLAINLACAFAKNFAEEGYKIMIADADAQGSASDWFNARCVENDNINVVNISRSIKSVRNLGADIVIVDTQASFSQATAELLTLSDIVLVTAKPSPMDLWASIEILSAVEKRKIIDPQLSAAIVLTQVKAGTLMTQWAKETFAERNVSFPVLHGTTDLEVYKHTLAQGLCVLESGNDKAKTEIEELLQQILEM